MRYRNIMLAAAAKSYRVLKRNKKIAIIGIILLFVPYIFQSYDNIKIKIKGYQLEGIISSTPLKNKHGNEYLIDTTNCQIPHADPFDRKIMKFVHKENYTDCRNADLLTYIKKKFDMVTLNINVSVLPQYNTSSHTISCCYSEIHRVEGDDDKIWFTSCNPFKTSVTVYQPFVKVVCHNKYSRKVYENVHATVTLDYSQYKNNMKSNSAFSVLLVGVDAVSKQNLRRTMPKSYQYLENHFINLKGYNKIDDNTYPNLMAILTGEDMDRLEVSCPFFDNDRNGRNKNKNFLAACNFIWKQFDRLGYFTAFGEDASALGTFNYAKRGFPNAPTDYYYRPYFLAAEQLASTPNRCHVLFCSGPENSGERLLNNVKDFSVTFKNRPSFGFFWMNSFSHDNFNCPSAMDDKVLQFLSDRDFVDSLENTIFVFYSDHGFRYGGIRQTFAGYLEERLPFIYLRFPHGFRRRFPKEYENVLVNSRRLTTPYDLYNTLQHILHLDNNEYKRLTSPACPKCESLFKEIAENRTCEEAGINEHWCTCINYHYIPTTNPLVEFVAPFVVREINDLVQSFPEGHKCAVYILDRVHLARLSNVVATSHKKMVVYLLLMVYMNPEAKFEVTVQLPVGTPYNLKIIRKISRINFYGDHIFCIRDYELMKYCYCPIQN